MFGRATLAFAISCNPSDGESALLDGRLDLGEPFVNGLLVPDAVDVAFARRGAATVSVMARLPASFRLSRCTSCGAKTNLLLNESKRARAFVR